MNQILDVLNVNTYTDKDGKEQKKLYPLWSGFSKKR